MVIVGFVLVKPVGLEPTIVQESPDSVGDGSKPFRAGSPDSLSEDGDSASLNVNG